MRTLFWTILLGFLFSAADSLATDVLVIESLRVKPFDEALRGFRSVCGAESKTVVLSDAEGLDLLKSVRDERPRVIVAIGAEALQKTARIRNVPIIYLMVLNPDRYVAGGENVVGVEMHIPPERYLALMERIHPQKLKVGILFDPEKTGALVKKILETAGSRGMEISAREIHAPRDVPEKLSGMKGSLNLFLMLPDSTVVTSESVEQILSFSRNNRIPVVTFAGKYLDGGALISLEIDGFDMGRQGGEMANRILDGISPAEISTSYARKATIRLNRGVAKDLGIDPNSLDISDSAN